MSENQPTTENATDTTPQKRTGCVRLCLGGVAVVLLLVLAVVAGLFYSRPLQISKETTYITEPRTADGKQVDYFAAIVQASRPENIATDENGYRLIVQHLGKDPDIDPAHFERICNELGLAADAIHPDMTYESQYAFLEAYVASDEFDQALLEDLLLEDTPKDNLPFELADKLGRPWTLDELPMMAQWLEQNGPALDLIGRAAGKPTFHIPLVRKSKHDIIFNDIVYFELPRMRSFARGLFARANYRIATGDIDGAIDDIIACKRLARHIGQGARLIDLLVGIAIEGMADAIGIAGSLDHPPTTEQFQRLLETEFPPEADFDQLMQVMRFEFFISLDIIQALAHGKDVWSGLGLPDSSSPPRYFTVLGFDWNIVAKRFREHFATNLAGDQVQLEGTSPRIGASLNPLPRARSEHLADDLAALLLGHWNAAREVKRRSTCRNQLKHVTLGMLIYERNHGTLPPAYSVDEQGEPLHSWRVLLLPYLGQQSLYDKIRLDQPWDSEHNRQFHNESVAFYRCPSHPEAEPGQTTYSVVVGPDMPFEGGQGKSLDDFNPNSDDMILVVERAEPVGWMDPTREIPQSVAEEGISRRADPFAAPPPSASGIASHHLGGANCGLRNGAILFLSETIDLQRFKEMLQGTHEEQ